jgi:hypothetical protein
MPSSICLCLSFFSPFLPLSLSAVLCLDCLPLSFLLSISVYVFISLSVRVLVFFCLFVYLLYPFRSFHLFLKQLLSFLRPFMVRQLWPDCSSRPPHLLVQPRVQPQPSHPPELPCRHKRCPPHRRKVQLHFNF